MSKTKIILELNEHEAWALAQMAKRFTYEMAETLSDRFAQYGGASERQHMLDAVSILQKSLANAGVSPR